MRTRLKLIAMFMMWLIITIPIYSASVFAGVATVHEVNVKGEKEIPGIISGYDYLDIEAVVSIAGDTEITPEQVWYGNGKFEEFNECAAEGGGKFRCKYAYPGVGQKSSWAKGQYSFNVYFYTDIAPYPADHTDQYTQSYVVDGIAPKVKSFDIVHALTSNNTVTINYAVEDYANIAGDTGKCSGISKVEVFNKDDKSTPLETYTYESFDCSLSDSKEITIAAEGKTTLCVKAFDNFGLNPSDFDVCDEVTIDKTGVDILVDTARLVGRTNGFPITHFKDSAISAEFSINISGPDLDKSSVVGNFSLLNPSQAGSYESLVPNSCTGSGIVNCKWDLDVKLDEAEAGTKDIVLEAKDLTGNLVSVTSSVTLGYDNIGPRPVSISSGITNPEGKPVISATKGVLKAEVVEEGSGLDPKDVNMYFDAMALNAINPSSCEKGANWVCKWENIDFGTNTQTVTVYLTTDSKDILGNAFTFDSEDRLEVELVIDNSDSVVNEIFIVQELLGTLDGRDVIPGFIATGDVLKITANVTEPNGLASAVGDFSIIIAAEHFASPGSCVLEGSDYICTWSGITITEPGFIFDNLKFEFTDIAGNVNTHEELILVFANEAGDPPDFYDLQIRNEYLVEIDRRTLEFLSTDYYREVVPMDLEFEGDCKEVEITNLRMVGENDCGEGRVFVNYAAQADGDYNGFMEFLIGKDYASANIQQYIIGGESSPCAMKFNVVCYNGEYNKEYDIYTEQTVYSVPETELVSFTIPVTDAIQSEIDSVTAQIDKIKEDTKSDKWRERLDKLEKIHNVVTIICRLKQTITSVITAITLVQGLFAVLADIIFPPTQSAGQGGGKAVGLVNQALAKIYNFLNGDGKSAGILARACAMAQCSSYDKRGNPTAGKELPDIFGDNSGKKVFFNWASGTYCDMTKQFIISQMDRGSDKDNFYNTKVLAGIDAFTQGSTLEMAKKSWVFSLACGCIPGLIYNLKKKRQLECWKGYCYRYMIPTGMSKAECDTQSSYQKCVYDKGQWTVFFDFIGNIINNLANLFEHPIASAWVGARIFLSERCPQGGISCASGSCSASWSTQCIPYNLMNLAEAIAETTTALNNKNYFNTDPVDIDYCKILLQEDEEEEDIITYDEE